MTLIMEAHTHTSGDDLARLMSAYETTVAQEDSTAALALVQQGLSFAANGEQAADLAFDLVERFGSAWSESEIDAAFDTLGKSETTLDKYRHVARIMLVDGVVKAGTQDWRMLRAAVGRVPASLTHTVIPRVREKVKAVREVRPEGTISYATVRNICDAIVSETKPKMSEDSALAMRVTTLHNQALAVEAALAEGKAVTEATISKLVNASEVLLRVLTSLNK